MFWNRALLIVGCLALLLPLTRAAANDQPGEEKKKPLVDVYGDPLPDGALLRMGTIRFRHGGYVTQVSFSPDGKTLMSLGADNVVRLWEIDGGKEIKSFKGQMPMGTPLGFSHDRKTMIVMGYDNAIKIVDLESGKELHRLGDMGIGAFNAAFSPDGKLVAAVCHDQTIRQWDVASGKETLHLKPEQPQNGKPQFNPQFISYAPDGKMLAVAGNDGANNGIRLLEAASGKEIKMLTGGQPGIMGPVISPDSKTIAALTDGNQIVRLWDVETGKETKTLQAQQNPQGYGFTTVAFSPDGKTLASAGNDSVKLWDVKEGKELKSLGESAGGFTSVAFSPDGKSVAAGTSNSVVRVWETATGKNLSGIGGHQGGITSIALSPDGKVLVTAGADKTIRLWDAKTGKELRQLTSKNREQDQNNPGIPVPDFGYGMRSTVIFSPDGKSVAGGWFDGTIRIWNVEDGKELKMFPGHQGGVTSIAFAPNAKTLASSGNDGATRVWQISTGKEVRKFGGIPNPVEGGGPAGIGIAIDFYGGGFGAGVVTFSPDGKTLAVLSANGGFNPYMPYDGSGSAVVLWEAATGKERRKIPVSMHSGGNPYQMYGFMPQLALGGGFGGIGWGWPYPGMGSGASTLTYVPGGKHMAVGSGDTIHLIDLTSAKEVRRFGGNQVSASSISFTPDAKLVACGSSDGKVFLWDVETGTVLGQIDGHRGEIAAVAFGPDGKTLISAGSDTTALVWDVKRLTELAKGKASVLGDKELEAFWKDLGGDDAQKAYQAITSMASASKQSLPYLKERVQAVPKVDQQMINQLIADLDNKKFAVRQKASEELEKLGDLAEPALQEVLKGSPSLEIRRRVEQLLEKLEGPVTLPEQLRAQRTVEIAELAGTPEAKEILEKLAKGAPGARVTEEAKAALERMNLKSSSKQ